METTTNQATTPSNDNNLERAIRRLSKGNQDVAQQLRDAALNDKVMYMIITGQQSED